MVAENVTLEEMKGMPRTPQWIKKLSGYAGEMYVAAELAKRGVPNVLLPENFTGDDILIAKKDGGQSGFIQVKACHPDRGSTFCLYEKHEKWVDAEHNQFVIFVWLGSPRKNEAPQYWIASKREVGQACRGHQAHGTDNTERRFRLDDLNKAWRDNWAILQGFMPQSEPQRLWGL